MSRNLRFKVGLAGWLAKFVLVHRMGRSHYEETIILPAVIFVIAARFGDLGLVSVRPVTFALISIPLLTGIWLGISLGPQGGIRVVLRSILVGAFEAGGYSALNTTVDRHQIQVLFGTTTYINVMLSGFSYMIMAMVGDVLTISEEDWQRGASRRAKIRTLFRALLGGEDFKTLPTGILIAARFIQWLGPSAFLTWIAWILTGENPVVFISNYLHTKLYKP